MDLEVSQQTYNEDTQALLNIINGIISSGEIKEEDKVNLDENKANYNVSYAQVNKDIKDTERSYNDSQLDYIKDQLMDLKSQIIKNDDLIQFSVSGTVGNEDSISEMLIELGKIKWIVKSGNSESSMELTDKMYSLMTEKVLIEAKKIELNGSININNGLFRVLTNGNTKIGGDTGNTVEGYARALLEITSNGNLYSVSPDSSKVYTKLSEGTLKVVNSSYTLTIDDAFASNRDVVLRSSLNSSTDGQGGSVWLCCNGGDIKTEDSRAIRYFKNSDGNYVVRPNSKAGVMYLGTATYPFKEVIAKTLTQTSDRTLKENITYLSNAMSTCDSSNDISIDDCYNFVSNDLPIAIYNYIDDMTRKIGFIAQDIIYNADETDNKVGQLIVDPKGYTDEDGKLTYDLGNFVSVLAGALQVAIRKIENLEGIINGSN